MTPQVRLLGTISPLALAFSSPVLGTEDPLDLSSAQLSPIVITSTLTPTPIDRAPGSVEVIDAEAIRQTGAETAAQALTDAVGMDLDHVAGRGVIPQIRGLTNKRVLVLLDGMRFATGFRDTTVDLSEFPVEVIERIEIVRGPTSALYGSDAIGGVVNIITRKPPATRSASATLQYGANKHGEAGNLVVRGFVGDTWDRLGASLAGQVNLGESYDREDWDDLTDFDDEERFSGMVNLHYRMSPDHSLSGGALVTSVDRQGIRPKYGLHWDRDADSERLTAFGRYDGRFGDTRLMARAYYSDFASDRSYVDTGSPYTEKTRQKTARQQPDREDFSLENALTQVELQVSHLFADVHRVSLGLEYREEKRSGVENRGERDIDERVENAAVFLQDDVSLWEKLNLVVGARLDDHSDFGSELSPRLNLLYSVRDNLRLKASYGHGFRAPSVYELYVYTENNKGDVIPNPDLDGETADSYELGLEGEAGAFSGALTLFRNDIQDMIYKEPTGNYRMSGKRRVLEYTRINLSEAYTQGVEVEAALDLPHNFSLRGNFTYLDTENEETGERLLEVPETKTFLRLAYDDPARGWHANLRLNLYGEQIIAPKFEDGSQDLEDPYAVWSLYAEKDLNAHLRLFGGIDNIFDEIPDYRPDRGTYFFAGLTLRF